MQYNYNYNYNHNYHETDIGKDSKNVESEISFYEKIQKMQELMNSSEKYRHNFVIENVIKLASQYQDPEIRNDKVESYIRNIRRVLMSGNSSDGQREIYNNFCIFWDRYLSWEKDYDSGKIAMIDSNQIFDEVEIKGEIPSDFDITDFSSDKKYLLFRKDNRQYKIDLDSGKVLDSFNYVIGRVEQLAVNFGNVKSISAKSSLPQRISIKEAVLDEHNCLIAGKYAIDLDSGFVYENNPNNRHVSVGKVSSPSLEELYQFYIVGQKKNTNGVGRH